MLFILGTLGPGGRRLPPVSSVWLPWALRVCWTESKPARRGPASSRGAHCRGGPVWVYTPGAGPAELMTVAARELWCRGYLRSLRLHFAAGGARGFPAVESSVCVLPACDTLG